MKLPSILTLMDLEREGVHSVKVRKRINNYLVDDTNRG